MKTSEFTGYLENLFPNIKFYTGAINRNETRCVGVYTRDSGQPSRIALGGLDNTSFSTLPITLLVRWGENFDACEVQATAIYDALLGKSNFQMGNKRIVSLTLLNSHPISVGRDEKNVCEMVIRLNIIHER